MVSALVNRLAEQLSGSAENIVLMDAVDSTHALAIRLMDQMEEERARLPVTVILARRQTEGLGRGGRGWASPEGGLYLNWIAAGLDASTIRVLPLLAAAAALRAVAAVGVAGAGLKWPNDILARGRKLAGILVHAHHGTPSWATVGLGVNLATAPRLESEPTRPTVAVAELLGPAPWEERSAPVAATFVRSLGEFLDDPGPALETWRSSLVHRRGDAIEVRTAAGTALRGTFLGVTDEGFLRLGTEAGEQVIAAGDVVEGD